MRELRIFDVSTFVHAGKVNKHSFLTPELKEIDDEFVEQRIYTGGVSLLWNTLYKVYGTCDLAFCLDTKPTIKQEMYDGYKANRQHNHEVWKQKRAMEYILKNCGFETLIEEGYEADDFIYSIVRDNKKKYDQIYIYTGDSDLYFLVDDNVTILPSSSRAKKVTKQNYTYTAGKKDSYIPYNATTFLKILEGDTSDNIPPLNPDISYRVRQGYYNDLFYEFLGDKETLREIFQRFGPEAIAQCELILPLDVRTPEVFKEGDKIRIAEWGNAIKNKLYRNNQPLPNHILASIEEMADLGLCADE